MVYVLSGLASGLAAAVLLTARLNSAQPIAGHHRTSSTRSPPPSSAAPACWAARARCGGTLIGALIMGVLRNGLNLLGISSFLQQVVIGIVIITAVLVDSVLKNSRRHP